MKKIKSRWYCRLCNRYDITDRTVHLMKDHKVPRAGKGGTRWTILLADLFKAAQA